MDRKIKEKSKYYFIRLLLIIGIGIVFLLAIDACRFKNKKTKTEEQEELVEKEDATKADLEDVSFKEMPFYILEYDETAMEEVIKQQQIFPEDNRNIPFALEKLNLIYPDILLEFQEQRADTAYFIIKDANVLTQQMGSHGAQQYLIDITYTFTSILGVNGIYLEFKEGDHAEPGYYDRKSWTYALD